MTKKIFSSPQFLVKWPISGSRKSTEKHSFFSSPQRQFPKNQNVKLTSADPKAQQPTTHPSMSVEGWLSFRRGPFQSKRFEDHDHFEENNHFRGSTSYTLMADGSWKETPSTNAWQGSWKGTPSSNNAATSIADRTAPFTGKYRPEESLDALNGISGTGSWTLTIQDRW